MTHSFQPGLWGTIDGVLSPEVYHKETCESLLRVARFKAQFQGCGKALSRAHTFRSRSK